jgi:hypothetical protein
MEFFFPDSQDLVDPSFEFESEGRDVARIRHRDDLYAHEIFDPPPYDGLLVSRAMVEGYGGSRYTLAQRQRLYREGGREFFRLTGRPLKLMADCGAFSYVNEERPPVSVQEVLAFYGMLGCDYGIAVDHVILAYRPAWDTGLFGVGGGAPPDVRKRQALTLELAQSFFTEHATRQYSFEPVGVAQGWSPQSYRHSLEVLQEIGYRYIALGGLVPLKTTEILAVLEAVAPVRQPGVRLHLLGVTRPEIVPSLSSYGVVSFDSTSPLRQAFKDGKDNYHTLDRCYVAVRVPQVEANPSLLRATQSGRISQGHARELERGCLEALRRYDEGTGDIEETLRWLGEYETLVDPKRTRISQYREVLEAQPWKSCPCRICRSLGHHVILFRGAERNRRRGFHNVWVARQRLDRSLGHSHSVHLQRGTEVKTLRVS